jgi:hypothetical protein
VRSRHPDAEIDAQKVSFARLLAAGPTRAYDTGGTFVAMHWVSL